MQFLILCVKCNFSGHNKEEETEEENLFIQIWEYFASLITFLYC